MDISPDLSHLTEDERKIIEAVINRQKAEEERDAVAIQSRMDDYSAPVAMAGRRYSQQTKTHPHENSSNESGVCCEVCKKTKFVDEQSVRQCSICKKRLCVRCGVRLKGHQYNKTFWLCNICRQKQESYFSSLKLIPTTNSVSQLTTTSINTNNINDDNTKNISKQYVSDYILSQPFDTNEKEDDDIKINKNGANKKLHQNIIQQRKRILPTTHIRRQQQKESKEDSSSEQDDDDAVSSPDSASVIDDNESVSRVNKNDEDILSSLPLSRSTHNNPQKDLKEFQYHSFEDKDLGHETTLKDSGIDTASSSTILNVLSIDPFKKPTTTWRLSENRTEKIGYVHLKNNTWTSTICDEYQQGKIIKGDIFTALGLKIQGGICQENEDGTITMISEIIKITPGSIADNCGQLQIGDQVLEWNGKRLTNLNSNDVYQIISQNSMQSPDIHMIVKRPIRYSTLSSNEQSLTTPPISIISSQGKN
ncbi:unnamed protein product [Rotaria sordida]|uniref:PDZ domain-containing protein n=1 Tax=Rotaria sordida TaxID=392033 RepID=A0A814HWM2_9BILA|nr:unnamed protein product [Rotaria sordida]CAF1016022.1 unnamed protein product [Rotaria sordida]CAF3746637.1 unnamed protein product [Rotaria sordida]CAF3941849.1 unnamed protein product [Rotaria sordida]